jgi:NAD+ synthase
MNAVTPIDTHERRDLREEILFKHGVGPTATFDPASACQQRVDYLKQFLRQTGLKGFVLGISGGVDSTTAGRLAQIACQQLREEGYQATFHAMRLPAGVQRDEHDAQAALAFIRPDNTLTVNVGPAADALNNQCLSAAGYIDPVVADFHKGNIKARFRMAAQYYFAGFLGAAVLGTDHESEATTGFFSKFGDGACDLIVLNGLNKRQVRLCAQHLGAPSHLFQKSPTADLEELNPGKLDDEGFGFPYEALDDFLEGKPVDPEVETKIVDTYRRTQHKRDPIVAFPRA